MGQAATFIAQRVRHHLGDTSCALPADVVEVALRDLGAAALLNGRSVRKREKLAYRSPVSRAHSRFFTFLGQVTRHREDFSEYSATLRLLRTAATQLYRQLGHGTAPELEVGLRDNAGRSVFAERLGANEFKRAKLVLLVHGQEHASVSVQRYEQDVLNVCKWVDAESANDPEVPLDWVEVADVPRT
jgi:hypothetical protein